MKSSAPLAVAVLLLLLSGGHAQDKPTPIVSEGLDKSGQLRIEVGQQQVFKLSRDCKRVSVARPDVVDIAMVSSTQVLATAKMPGSTDITVWDDKDVSQTFRAIVRAEAGARATGELFPPTGTAVEASEIPGFIILNLRTGKVHLAISQIVAVVIEDPPADAPKNQTHQTRIVVSADAQEIHPEHARSFVVPRERMGGMDVIQTIASAKRKQAATSN